MTILWLGLFAQVLYVPLAAPHYMVTAGACWLFLALSRSIRTARNSASDTNDPRTRFFRAERWPLLTITPFVLLSIVIMAVNRLRWLEQTGLFVLAALALLYLVCSAFYFRETERLFPREIVSALLSGSLIALFVLANGIFPPQMVGSLLVLLVVLFVLCFWTSSILEWRDRVKESKPFSLHLLRTELKVAWISAFVALLALGLAPLDVNAPFAAIFVAIAAAAANLALLARYGELISGIHARCLSRLMLFTPLIPLALAWAGL